MPDTLDWLLDCCPKAVRPFLARGREASVKSRRLVPLFIFRSEAAEANVSKAGVGLDETVCALAARLRLLDDEDVKGSEEYAATAGLVGRAPNSASGSTSACATDGE